ncbi:MAG: AAA family ATPase [Rhizobacter sp.]|nr:AAA family ATPase [Rhizobacter sp.]
MPTPAQTQTLLDLLATRTPVLVIETHEEPRVLALFAEVAKRTDREVWSWSVSRGLRVAHGLKLSLLDFGKKEDGSSNANDTKELPQALAQIERLDAAAIVLLLDVHPYLSNPVITRAMKELALKCEKEGRQLVLVGHDLDLPNELSPFSSRFEVEPMTLERVQKVFTAEMGRLRGQSGRDVSGCRDTLQSLLRHMVGLPEASVRHMVRLALSDGQITAADLATVLSAKNESLGVAELLVFEQRLPSMNDVAGMVALKKWLAARRVPFLQPDTSGLPPPRGMLLLGVQGAGKSLAAKAIASSWQLPLFRMDFGALFDKFQGESERKLREALRVADAMQPCVLWMDEIEKGLASGSGDGDTGAGKRMLGTLLTWMAERRSSVFMVATANDIESLPPELMRKGRFDEIFFVDLPDRTVREAIFRIHLGRHKVGFNEVALQALVERSEGYSGAEIEAAVVASRYEAHAANTQADATHVGAELRRTKPLSVTRSEAVQALRAWAAGRTVSAD